MINRMFVLHAWSDVTYINREEGYGYSGLRKAKSHIIRKNGKEIHWIYLKEGTLTYDD